MPGTWFLALHTLLVIRRTLPSLQAPSSESRAPSPEPRVLSSRVRFKPFDELGRASIASRDHQNRVIARDGSHDLGKARAIDRERQRLRLPRSRADDDELLDAVDFPQELGGGVL